MKNQILITFLLIACTWQMAAHAQSTAPEIPNDTLPELQIDPEALSEIAPVQLR